MRSRLVVMPVGDRRGGAEASLLDLLRNADATGASWEAVFLEDGTLVEAAEHLGIRSQVIPLGRVREPRGLGRATRALATLVRRRAPDVVVSWMPKAHLLASPAAALDRRPAVVQQPGLAKRTDPIDRAVALMPTRGFIVPGERAAAAQRAIWPRHPVEVVHPGVDLRRFDAQRALAPAEARKALGLPGEGVWVGIVGRLQRWKGMHTLVEAIALLADAHPDVRGLVVGGAHPLETAYEDELRRRITDRGLGDRVVMLGHRSDIPLCMQAMDIVVHASADEPFGIVVLEAMALAKPLVAGDTGGPVEVITPGLDGLLTGYEDVEALAQALAGLLADPEAATRMGAAARGRAEQFSDLAFATRFEAAIARMTTRPR